jgi:N-acyl-D-aspartate/D-glutamate deacylase
MHDTIIRGGTIVDGSGAAPYTADVAIQDGRIAEIGRVSGAARETIDADGAIITPGFIDHHTHYDGQFLWDDRMDPSFSHGVTTAIAGNCGVGFAPVADEHRRALVEFMSGVEDIPGIVLDEGLDWKWRSFPDYLNRLAARSYAMDVASHITHAPLRVFVMGERALRHEKATPEDIEAMCGLVREGMAAGAAGFSTGRIVEHRSSRGEHVPGTFAVESEVTALGRAMGERGRGVFQVAPKGMIGALFMPEGDAGREARLAEQRLLETVAAASGRPVSFAVVDVPTDPDDIQVMVEACDRALARGVQIYPQISPRGATQVYMLDGYHIFLTRPSYREVAHLPLPERLLAMRQPERRKAILTEPDVDGEYANDAMTLGLLRFIKSQSPVSYILKSPLDFEPTPDQRLDALAAAANKTQEEYLYDYYTSGSGENFNVNFVFNYHEGNLDITRALLANPNVITGLSDGGAHMQFVCDSSLTTFQLAFWARTRQRGATLPLETIVRKLTSDPARLYGLSDRGLLGVGKRADINVIDFDALEPLAPYMVRDLPSGSKRLLQGSRGYLATLVAGVATRRNDADTGARPGRLVRATNV